MHDQRRASRTGLDPTSRGIIEQLRQDGRRSYAAIGKAVGLSEAAVRQRVQRLVESGVMRVAAVSDPHPGAGRRAMIGIRAAGDLPALADGLAAIAEVDSVMVTTGGFDLLVEVVCDDDQHLLAVLNEQVRTVPGVRSTETFVYLAVRRQLYTWQPR